MLSETVLCTSCAKKQILYGLNIIVICCTFMGTLTSFLSPSVAIQSTLVNSAADFGVDNIFFN